MREVIANPFMTHGGKGTRLYRVWTGMKSRCLDEGFRDYPAYGGRGIKVCNEWLDFAVFRDWSMANGYSNNLSLDRVDNDGPYSPENCRWATGAEQCQNRRNNKLDLDSATAIYYDHRVGRLIAKEHGVSETLVKRIKRGELWKNARNDRS